MNSQAHGKYPKDCSQLCHHGFQIRTWFPTCLVYPPAWPQQGLLPCLRWEGVGAAPREAGQRPSCSISSWRDSTQPPPRQPYTVGLPHSPAGLLVRHPSQAQAGLWFISAAPAASLSRLVNRGSGQGRRRGLLWATSGFRAFLVPVPIFPQKGRVQDT